MGGCFLDDTFFLFSDFVSSFLYFFYNYLFYTYFLRAETAFCSSSSSLLFSLFIWDSLSSVMYLEESIQAGLWMDRLMARLFIIR
jgi:hypothetical protein